jgi:hypothetical protein
VPKQAQVHNRGNAARPTTGVAKQPASPRANDTQVAGNHYKQFQIEPWDAIVDWGLGYLDGNAVKYLSRWRHKNGIEDLKKARHYIDKLLETEMEKHNGTDPESTANRMA